MWLTTEEARLAGQRLAYNGSHGGASTMTWKEAKATLMDWRLYIHYVVRNDLVVPRALLITNNITRFILQFRSPSLRYPYSPPRS
jgi:hypothetical protein